MRRKGRSPSATRQFRRFQRWEDGLTSALNTTVYEEYAAIALGIAVYRESKEKKSLSGLPAEGSQAVGGGVSAIPAQWPPSSCSSFWLFVVAFYLPLSAYSRTSRPNKMVSWATRMFCLRA